MLVLVMPFYTSRLNGLFIALATNGARLKLFKTMRSHLHSELYFTGSTGQCSVYGI
jgi:hypothetical protein